MVEEVNFDGCPTQPYLVALYDVVNPDQYYRLMDGLVSGQLKPGRRALYVSDEVREKIAPILETLMRERVVKKLSLLFENTTRIDMYNVKDWASCFLRPIKLGMTEEQVRLVRAKMAQTINSPQHYDRFLGARSDLWDK